MLAIIKNSIAFLKFGSVGLCGALVGFSLFFFFVDFKNALNQNQGFVVSFASSATVNYFFHFFWTFRKENKREKMNVARYFTFIIISLISLVINFALFKVLMALFKNILFLQEYSTILLFFSTGIASLSSFYLSRKFVFLEKIKKYTTPHR